MHSRDTTVLIDFLWLNVVHYSSLFQYFFQSIVVPDLVEKFLIFSALVLYKCVYIVSVWGYIVGCLYTCLNSYMCVLLCYFVHNQLTLSLFHNDHVIFQQLFLQLELEDLEKIFDNNKLWEPH